MLFSSFGNLEICNCDPKVSDPCWKILEYERGLFTRSQLQATTIEENLFWKMCKNHEIITVIPLEELPVLPFPFQRWKIVKCKLPLDDFLSTLHKGGCGFQTLMTKVVGGYCN